MAENTAVNTRNEQRKVAEPDDRQQSAGEAALEHFKQYARERPEVVALWAFGIGFVFGWKLKPW